MSAELRVTPKLLTDNLTNDERGTKRVHSGHKSVWGTDKDAHCFFIKLEKVVSHPTLNGAVALIQDMQLRSILEFSDDNN